MISIACHVSGASLNWLGALLLYLKAHINIL